MNTGGRFVNDGQLTVRVVGVERVRLPVIIIYDRASRAENGGRPHTEIHNSHCAWVRYTVAAMATKAMQMVYAMLVTFILNWEITQRFKGPNGGGGLMSECV